MKTCEGSFVCDCGRLCGGSYLYSTRCAFAIALGIAISHPLPNWNWLVKFFGKTQNDIDNMPKDEEEDE